MERAPRTGLLVGGLDAARVDFEVVTPGTRGLLDVGYVTARAAASTSDEPRASTTGSPPAPEGEDAQRLGRLLERATAALGVSCRIEVAASPELLTATCVGEDLGRLVGRDGQTLDALELLADRSAAAVMATGRRVELEPMSAAERKLIHTELEQRTGVATSSEGADPHRRVVIEPA
jgi:predicted RNA-binding protein Jag